MAKQSRRKKRLAALEAEVARLRAAPAPAAPRPVQRPVQRRGGKP